MAQEKNLACTICGESAAGMRRGFIVVADPWRDKLKILHWDDRLAAVPGIHGVCCAGHLRQLVVHWMTTGSVDHPFARAEFRLGEYERRRIPRPPMEMVENNRLRPVGELAVHRESMQRVLGEHPESLQTILDALLSALHRGPDSERQIPWEEAAAPLLLHRA